MIVMPDTMSVERRLLMQAYGAEVMLTDGKLGMNGAIAKAEELAKIHSDSWIAGQFVNPDNPEIHTLTTGPEIWQDTDGQVDVLIAGHHGAEDATGENLLRAVSPDTVIISAGKDNQYGHPSAKTLERLNRFGCKVLRTDQMGTIVYRR